ncbi:hypothetical protein B296_00013452 [Ensete ventricosum]|uniref:Uncharacterized protein n=1 Tax=Ensete ventricosum TaxID=4639 RepID=A0A427A4Z9_ENSVE|nr:hypothetical protein B296_00013452 [Ensete ventricosum]
MEPQFDDKADLKRRGQIRSQLSRVCGRLLMVSLRSTLLRGKSRTLIRGQSWELGSGCRAWLPTRLPRRLFLKRATYKHTIPREGAGQVAGGEAAIGRPQRPKLMRDLCQMQSQAKGGLFHALRISDLSEGEPDAPLEACWLTLWNSNRFWANSASAVEFGRGVLNLNLTKQLYGSPSKVLIDRVAKSLAKFPDLAIEEDPFVNLPKDANVPMEEEQRFDNSLPPEN